VKSVNDLSVEGVLVEVMRARERGSLELYVSAATISYQEGRHTCRLGDPDSGKEIRHREDLPFLIR
jgi:hypothetical protein